MVTQLLIKLFMSVNIGVISECELYFNFILPSKMTGNRRAKFESKFVKYCNSLLHYFAIHISVIYIVHSYVSSVSLLWNFDLMNTEFVYNNGNYAIEVTLISELRR